MDFDYQVFADLEDEFGGLAGNWVKKQNGEWSMEAVEDALLQLYRRRNELDGVTDQYERCGIARAAFGSLARADRLAERLRQLTT